MSLPEFSYDGNTLRFGDNSLLKFRTNNFWFNTEQPDSDEPVFYVVGELLGSSTKPIQFEGSLREEKSHETTTMILHFDEMSRPFGKKTIKLGMRSLHGGIPELYVLIDGKEVDPPNLESENLKRI